VIAVACPGEIRCRQSAPMGSGDGREEDVPDAVVGAVDGRDGVGHSKTRSIRAAPA
jgi:hypothetical protein